MADRRHTYTIVLDPGQEEGGYTVAVPALPGCITQGDTVEQCVERAQEAMSGYLESLVARGLPIPVETESPRLIHMGAPDASSSVSERSASL
jgi:antitoxin HicB